MVAFGKVNTGGVKTTPIKLRAVGIIDVGKEDIDVKDTWREVDRQYPVSRYGYICIKEIDASGRLIVHARGNNRTIESVWDLTTKTEISSRTITTKESVFNKNAVKEDGTTFTEPFQGHTSFSNSVALLKLKDYYLFAGVVVNTITDKNGEYYAPVFSAYYKEDIPKDLRGLVAPFWDYKAEKIRDANNNVYYFTYSLEADSTNMDIEREENIKAKFNITPSLIK